VIPEKGNFEDLIVLESGRAKETCKMTFGELMVGFSISQTNANSQWNPVYNHFIEFFVVETKRFVGSTVHVILARQTCGQRSSKAAESKR